MMRDALERSPVRRDAPSKGADAAAVHVTGVGGIVGQQVLRSLGTSRRRLVGVDMSECAAGLYAADRGYLVPPARHPGYVDRLLEIAANEGARYLFPGLDMELPILARAADRFRAAGIVPIVGPPDLVDLADDKLETARFLDRHGLPALRTVDLAAGDPGELTFPLVLKPRRGGRGSGHRGRRLDGLRHGRGAPRRRRGGDHLGRGVDDDLGGTRGGLRRWSGNASR